MPHKWPPHEGSLCQYLGCSCTFLHKRLWPVPASEWCLLLTRILYGVPIRHHASRANNITTTWLLVVGQCTPKSSTTGTDGFGLLYAELCCCPNTFEEQPENVVLTRSIFGLTTARLVTLWTVN